MENQAALSTRWQEARNTMDREIDNGEIAQMMTSPEFMTWMRSVDPTFEFPDSPRLRYPLRPEALLENRDLLQAGWIMRNAKANLRTGRANIREDAVRLLARVEREIE